MRNVNPGTRAETGIGHQSIEVGFAERARRELRERGKLPPQRCFSFIAIGHTVTLREPTTSARATSTSCGCAESAVALRPRSKAITDPAVSLWKDRESTRLNYS